MGIKVNAPGRQVRFKVDTGAYVTVISVENLQAMGMGTDQIRRTKKKLMGPCNQEMKCLGYVVQKLTWQSTTSSQILYVCKNLKKPLLGKPAIRDLKMLKLDCQQELFCDALEESSKKEDRSEEARDQENRSQ